MKYQLPPFRYKKIYYPSRNVIVTHKLHKVDQKITKKYKRVSFQLFVEIDLLILSVGARLCEITLLQNPRGVDLGAVHIRIKFNISISI